MILYDLIEWNLGAFLHNYTILEMQAIWLAKRNQKGFEYIDEKSGKVKSDYIYFLK